MKPVNKDRQVRLDRLVCRAKRVRQDHLDRRVPQAQSASAVSKARLVLKVCRVPLVLRAQRASKAQPGIPVLKATKGLLDRSVLMVPQDSLDRWVLLVPWVRRANRAYPERRDHVARKATPDLLGQAVQQDPLVRKAPPAHRVSKDRQVPRVPRASKG